MTPRSFLGAAAEWIHHVAAISLTVGVGGPKLTAAYLALYVLPAYLVKPPRWTWVLSPAAFVAVVFVPHNWPWLLAVAAIAGIGRAGAERPSAWLAGLEMVSGLPAFLGAAVGAALITTSETAGFVGAAVACSVGVTSGFRQHGPVGPLLPAVLGACVVVGMRVIEPVLLLDPVAGAAFTLAWAAGAGLAGRWAARADARAVAAAPFLASAAIALMGSTKGPGMLFLWGAVAVGVCLPVAAAPRKARPASTALPVITVIGAAGLSVAGWFDQLPSILWFGAAALLAGGFVSLAGLARGPRELPAEPRVEVEEPVEEPVEEAIAEEVPALVEPDELLRVAATELLQALRSAREIRSAALIELRMSMDPLSDLKTRTSEALANLERVADEVGTKLGR